MKPRVPHKWLETDSSLRRYERLSSGANRQSEAEYAQSLDRVLESLGQRLGRHDRYKARKHIEAAKYRLALERIAHGLWNDDVAITHDERHQLLELAKVMDSEEAAVDIDLCPDAPTERTETWLDAVVRVGRRIGHGLFYLVMVALFCLFVILGVGSAQNAFEHQAVVWGTFTEESCLSGYHGCRSIGRWTSDDGTMVKEGVYLDGSPGNDGTARANYQPSGFNNDSDSNLVHVQWASSMSLWYPWVGVALSAGAVVYAARRWKRERALRFEVCPGG